METMEMTKFLYSSIYIEVNFLGIVMALLVFFKMRREGDQQVSSIAFSRATLSVAVTLLLDAAWMLIDGLPGPVWRFLNYFVNVNYLFMTGVVMYFWFQYVIYRFQLRTYILRKHGVLLALPLLTLLALCVASPWTGWLFTIDELNVYQRGPLHIAQQLIGYSYGLAAIVCSVWTAFRTRDPERRADALTINSFVLLPLVGGVLSGLLFGLPTIWPFTTVSLVSIYMNFQGRQISTDSLTRLNNRSQFDRHLKSLMTDPHHGTDDVYLLLIDVDDFKKINDTYGHVVGDEALIQTANLLKGVCGTWNAFLARYGGDEFAIVCATNEHAAIEHLKTELTEAFRRFSEQELRAYPLSISIGVTAFHPADGLSPTAVVEKADKELYAVKATKLKRMSPKQLRALALRETDVEGALRRLYGNEELYKTCLIQFLDDPTMGELNAAGAAKAWDDAFTAAHALKWLAGNLGFVPLMHDVGRLVTIIRSGRSDEIPDCLSSVNSRYRDITDAIRMNFFETNARGIHV